MAAILTITVKGTSSPEIIKNLQIVDTYMNERQQILIQISNQKIIPNLRVYYSGENVAIKDLHKILTDLRMDKTINNSIKSMYYHGSLNKI